MRSYLVGMIGIVSLAALLLSGPAPAAAVAKPAVPAQTMPSLFSDADYPAVAIRNREQGAVGFRLEVGADGQPAGCSVVSSSGSEALDLTTCRLLMERARFTPALDAKGNPTGDNFTGRIIWRLGEEVPPRLTAARMLWTTCVWGEASKLAPGDLPADEVARRSFLPCAPLEALLAQELRAPVPLEEARAPLTRMIAEGLTPTRAALKASPERSRQD